MKTLREIILESARLEEATKSVAQMSREEKLEAFGKFALEIGGLINKKKLTSDEATKQILDYQKKLGL